MTLRKLISDRFVLLGLLLFTLVLASGCRATTPEADAPPTATATLEATGTATMPPPTATEPPTATSLPPTPTTAPADDASRETQAPTVEMLDNATYEGIYEEPVSLSGGSYEGEPFVEGGASKPTVMRLPLEAFGDLNGDGVDDAVTVLAENSGGSGTFMYLAALVNQDGALANVATTLLGDRVQVETLSIEEGQIVVEAVTHGPDDPLCCPTLPVTSIYELQGEQLVEISSEEAAMEDASPELVGPVWRWEQTLMNDDSELIPENPGNYTVQFMEDGTVSIQADCNQVLGSYTVDGNSLAIMLGPSTLAACPEGSLGDDFVANLTAAASFFFEEGNLLIDLMMDSGTMRFEAQSTELAGTTWVVTGYNNGREAVVSPLLDTELTATFGADGTVGGSAGCNQYNASYEVSENNITIGLAASTMMACEEPEGVMEQEQAYLAALQSAATYRFRGELLEMRTAEDSLVVTFQRRPASVSGTVTYLQRIALPNDAVVIVRISDTSLQDVAAEVIGEQIINTEGQQVPIPYEVPYNPDDIVNPNYSVSARIEDSTGKLLFISDTNIPVITGDNPTENVEIVVVPVGG